MHPAPGEQRWGATARAWLQAFLPFLVTYASLDVLMILSLLRPQSVRGEAREQDDGQRLGGVASRDPWLPVG
jgi:hypothetical protein